MKTAIHNLALILSATCFAFAAPGDLDSTFGTGGKVTTAIGSNSDARSVLVQSDGKIVAAGTSGNGSNNVFLAVRYNTGGSLDATFGTGGKVTTSFGSGYACANSAAVQSDGKIVAAGSYYMGGGAVFAVVRYNTDGSLDATFGMGGKVTTSIGFYADYGNSVALQSDGKIVVAGVSNNDDIAVVRYNTDGSLDATFGTGGKVTTSIGSGMDYGNSVVLQSNGKIVVTGWSYNGSKNDFAVVRYNTDGSLDGGIFSSVRLLKS